MSNKFMEPFAFPFSGAPAVQGAPAKKAASNPQPQFVAQIRQIHSPQLAMAENQLQILPGAVIVARPMQAIGPGDQINILVFRVQRDQPGQILDVSLVTGAGGDGGTASPKDSHIVRLRFQGFGQIAVHIRLAAAALALAFHLAPAEGPQQIKARLLWTILNGFGQPIHAPLIFLGLQQSQYRFPCLAQLLGPLQGIIPVVEDIGQLRGVFWSRRPAAKPRFLLIFQPRRLVSDKDAFSEGSIANKL